MSEAKLRGTVLTYLRPLHGVAVENMLERGTPDLAYIGGWIELKYLRAWPKKAESPVRVKNRPAQIPWAKNHTDKGGTVYWLVNVGNEWLLFDMSKKPMPSIGTMTRLEMYAASKYAWHKAPGAALFRKALEI